MSTSAHYLWQQALVHLREELPERTIENWLVKAVPERLETEEEPAHVVLHVQSQFCRNYLVRNFRGQIEKALGDLYDKPVELTLQVDPSMNAEQQADPETEAENAPSSRTSSPASHQTTVPSGFPSDGNGPSRSADADEEQQTFADRPPSSNLGSPPDVPQKDTKSAPFSPEGLPTSEPPDSPDPSHPTAGTPSPTVENDESNASPPSVLGGDGKQASGTQSADHLQFSEEEQALRPEFTFNQFLEGDSNRLARSASVAVAQKPGGTKYNPLAVYGEVGLGKTHLAQAIANYALEHETANTVCYVSSERFTSQFVKSIREDDFNAFSNHYRNVDLLVVDDVQFFGGKEKTQEEFFHLFNNLHQHGKQIVLCADRPPKEISGIEDRLLSRFQWGLTADIQRPDLEMRMAVLQMKADQLNLDLDAKILELIAQNITENIRQLEGALKQLAARAQLIEGDIDTATTHEILEREYEVGSESRQAKIEDIIEAVASYYSLSTDDLVSRSRRQKISNARQVAMYLSRELTDLSYESIGLRFGGRDHSTVIHAVEKIQDQLDVRPEFEDELSSVQSEIRARLFSG